MATVTIKANYVLRWRHWFEEKSAKSAKQLLEQTKNVNQKINAITLQVTNTLRRAKLIHDNYELEAKFNL